MEFSEFSHETEVLFASLSADDRRLVFKTAASPPPKEVVQSDPLFWTLVRAFHESAPEPVRSLSLKDFASVFTVGWACALSVYGIEEEVL